MQLWLSIDGTPEEHRQVRNDGQSYDSVLRLLDRLAPGGPVACYVNTVLRRGAMDWLPPLARILAERRLKGWRIYDLGPWRPETFDALRPLREDYLAFFHWLADRRLLGDESPPTSFVTQLWWGRKLEQAINLRPDGRRAYETRGVTVDVDQFGRVLEPVASYRLTASADGPKAQLLGRESNGAWRAGLCAGCEEWDVCRGGDPEFRNADGPWRCGYQLLQGR
ncbi:MAG: hypothetical protein HKL90_05875 [Elusimicrobia bacterium]|nr:hypothetical protein [Elusimicrobiota bacterium]